MESRRADRRIRGTGDPLIDDDNYLYDCDYLRGHDHVGREIEIDVIAAESGWFNVCHFLEAEGGREFFARGYPLSQRELSRATHSVAQGRGKVVVNGGLWLGRSRHRRSHAARRTGDGDRLQTRGEFCACERNLVPFQLAKHRVGAGSDTRLLPEPPCGPV